jgi:hypothetical protein
LTSNVKARLAALTLACLTGALLIAACGDDDDGGADPSNEADTEAETAYLEVLAGALSGVNGQLDDLDQLRAAAFDAGPDAAAAAAYGTAYETYMSDRVAALEPLTPPDSLATQHARLASAAADTLALAGELSDALTQSPPATQADFQALFGELDGATITGRFRDACTALQSRATAIEAEVDLGCLR